MGRINDDNDPSPLLLELSDEVDDVDWRRSLLGIDDVMSDVTSIV